MTTAITLTDAEKAAIQKQAQPTIDGLLTLLYAQALATKVAAAAATAATTPATGTGTSTGSTGTSTGSTGSTAAPTALPYSTAILDATESTFTVATNALLVKGQVIAQLAGVQSVNVVDVKAGATAGQSILTSDQANLVPKNIIGKNVQFTANGNAAKPASSTASTPATGSSSTGSAASTGSTGSSSSTPATGTTGTPATSTSGSTGTTAPATGTGTTASAGTVTAQINDVTTDQWTKGVWTGSAVPMISFTWSADVVAAFTTGVAVTLGDGSVMTIAGVTNDGAKYYNVNFVGSAALDPTKVGAPLTASAPKPPVVGAAVAETQLDTSNGVTFGGITFPKVVGINSRGGKKGRILINCGMGAGGTSILPGVQGTNYALPTETELRRAKAMGAVGIRMGFVLERVIAAGGASRLLTTSEITGTRTIDTIIANLILCAQIGLEVMLDAHNYGRFSETGSDSGAKPYGTVGGWSVDRLGNDWFAILTEIKKTPAAWAALTKIDTMNEWVDQTYPQLKAIEQSLVTKLATISEDKIIVLEGINYASCVNWVANNPDYYSIVHPKGKAYLEFSSHLYLDQQASGYYESVGDTISAADTAAGYTFATLGIKRITGFAQWGATNGVTLNIGENIVPGKYPNLLQSEIALLAFCIASGIDVYIFGMSDWFGDNQHNIELAYNAPMLTVMEGAAQYAVAA